MDNGTYICCIFGVLLYNPVGGLGFAKHKENGHIKFLCTGSVLDFNAGYVKLIHIVYSHDAWYVLLSISIIGKEYFEKPHVTHHAEDKFAWLKIKFAFFI
jgi:hypothetical protein